MKGEMERKGLSVELKQGGDEGEFVARVATLNVRDRDGDVTRPGAFEDGKAVPVSHFGHGSSRDSELTVGAAVLTEEGNEVLATGRFNLKTLAGREHYETLKFNKENALRTEWSYAFIPSKISFGDFDGGQVRFLESIEVFEVSPVLVGAGMGTELLGIKSLETKGAIGPHTTPKADEGADWDAGMAMREADEDEAILRRMHAWVDEDADPDTKTAYKLPHHMPDGTVIWRGVAAAMGALLGARGGVAIPSDDRRGVYNHLSRHYSQFDKEPPEFRDMPLVEEGEAVLAAAQSFSTRMRSLADLRGKEGRVLSAVNVERLKNLHARLRELEQGVGTLLEEADTEKGKALSLYLEFQKIQTSLVR